MTAGFGMPFLAHLVCTKKEKKKIDESEMEVDRLLATAKAVAAGGGI